MEEFDFPNQIQQIETLLSSNSKVDKSFGYATLLHLQQQSNEHPPAIRALANRLRPIFSSTLSDITKNDEEIAVQAMKCLGFMIYHPTLVSHVTEDVANLVVKSLVKLIRTTQTKAVCNLGVWCISIQQLTATLLASHFSSLLSAVIHALDNSFDSLSITYEALQAILKLATQVSGKMRDTSNIWVPLICRRLLSIDKRERDITERCLLQLRPTICPPSLCLSKALSVDLKKKLLPEMKDMLQNPRRKFHAIQAWGWFLCLLGSHALKKKHLINEMLKTLEHAFSDSDSKMQLMSLSAWKGLVDALIVYPVENSRINMDGKYGVQQIDTEMLDRSQVNPNEEKKQGFLRNTKLIMVPLVGIMSTRCDVSVRLACLNTWCYLLHKLDLSVNCPSVLKLVLEPILVVVFRMGPDSKNILLWNSCLDLLDEFVSAKYGDGHHDNNDGLVSNLSAKTSLISPPIDKCASKDYLIKWLPWDVNKLDFHLEMVQILINKESMKRLTPENRSLVCKGALRIFRSILKGIQKEWKMSCGNYDEIMSCLKAILSSMKHILDDLVMGEFSISDHFSLFLHFVESVREELEPSLLAFPLYKVSLDLKYINELQLVNKIEYPELKGIRSVNYMDKVSPMLYFTILLLCLVSQEVSNKSQLEIILQEVEQQVKYILSSHNPLEDFNVIISLLFMLNRFVCVKVWKVIANCLKEHLDSIKSISPETEIRSENYMATCWFLAFPFVMYFCSQNSSTPMKICSSSLTCQGSTQSEMELQYILEAWTSVYGSMNRSILSNCPSMNCFSEGLCGILLKFLTQKASIQDVEAEKNFKEKNQNTLIFLFGETAVCILKHILAVADQGLRTKASKTSNSEDNFLCSGIKNCLEFVSRFLRLSLVIAKGFPESKISVIARVFATLANTVSHLQQKKDIILFVETVFDPLAHWLSAYSLMHGELQVSIINELQHLWAESLNCLRRSEPPIIFDSTLLSSHATILETTLIHSIPSIFASTIAFWNCTYGMQDELDYPQNLLPILDKLSRQGRISIHKRNPLFFVNDHSIVRAEVATAHKHTSKRVELVNIANDMAFSGVRVAGLRRKRLEPTEHQKEVKRAQQSRERDCNGHGPGLRTYTSVDFSQTNDDSQESQDIRNPETILELLRRA
ncbi:hypothetical protein Syun_025705 [Stephania yunnanensis]|uniref:Telomere-associated protein Rif1 N-terminal domain-containing protein n=1 Tax=Stephania yunnanensis TaxID=152371 RepID=A0AAP0EUS1_9MAGN